jgi:ankyrin repeat protein
MTSVHSNSLSSAIESNDIALVASLIAGGSVNVNARVANDLQRCSLLWLAAKLGRAEIVTLLLDAGARIDDFNDQRETPCHAAVRFGHCRVVEQLIVRRANLSLRDRRENRPVDIAIELGDAAVMAVFIALAPLDGETVCNAAVVSVNFIHQFFTQCDGPYDLRTIRGASGCTPLHIAARRTGTDVVTKLIEIGVDIDACDTEGRTCTFEAVVSNNVDALRCFIAAGANVDIPDDEGDTPLHLTVYTVYTGYCAFELLGAGADVHARNRAGQSACFVAAKQGPVLAMRAMLAFGADFDAPDNSGVTPRQLASRRSISWTAGDVALARRHVVLTQLRFVRKRAFEICVALQALELDAVRTIEILRCACGPVAPLIQFHLWWQIVTTIKHSKRDERFRATDRGQPTLS